MYISIEIALNVCMCCALLRFSPGTLSFKLSMENGLERKCGEKKNTKQSLKDDEKTENET